MDMLMGMVMAVVSIDSLAMAVGPGRGWGQLGTHGHKRGAGASGAIAGARAPTTSVHAGDSAGASIIICA